jgi:antitoxin MazE
MTVRLCRWGNSIGLRIPKAFLAQAGLREGDEIEIAVVGGSIILRPVLPDYSLAELAERITPENRHGETDWGPPAGQEVL